MHLFQWFRRKANPGFRWTTLHGWSAVDPLEDVYERIRDVIYGRLKQEIEQWSIEQMCRQNQNRAKIRPDRSELHALFEREFTRDEMNSRMLQEIEDFQTRLEEKRQGLVRKIQEREQPRVTESLREFYLLELMADSIEDMRREAAYRETTLAKLRERPPTVEQLRRPVFELLYYKSMRQIEDWEAKNKEMDELHKSLSYRDPSKQSNSLAVPLRQRYQIRGTKPLPKIQLKHSK